MVYYLKVNRSGALTFFNNPIYFKYGIYRYSLSNYKTMNSIESFSLSLLDYFAFIIYFAVLCLIGFWFGRKEKTASEDYFLAGRTLPWYVVGSSFIASNISTEHFIGMIVAAVPKLKDEAKPLWQEAKELNLIFNSIYQKVA